MFGFASELETRFNKLSKLSAAGFDSFVKSMVMITRVLGCEIMTLVDSRLLTEVDEGRFKCTVDLSRVFPVSTTMTLIPEPDQIDSLRAMGSNDPVLMLESERAVCFTNDKTLQFIWKFPEGMPGIEIPVLSPCNRLGESVKIPDTTTAAGLVRGAAWAELLGYNNQITGLFAKASETIHIFEGTSAPDVLAMPADLVVYTLHFLRVCGAQAELSLHLDDGRYWLKTETDLGKNRRGKKARNTENIGPTVTTFERVRVESCNKRLIALFFNSN